MDAKRRAAQIPKVVIDWFKGFKQIRIFYGIEPENMWNFDETGVWNACPAGTWVWVPTSIKEVYFILFKSIHLKANRFLIDVLRQSSKSKVEYYY
jgi:hypothetical protein